MSNKTKIAVVLIAASAAFFVPLKNKEGYTAKPVIPVAGDVPTQGHGTTVKPNGQKVKMTDPAISRDTADKWLRYHVGKDEAFLKKSLPNVKLTQTEYEVYLDFIYQYGQSAWSGSSMRRLLLANKPRQACDALLKWKYVAKRDCSIRKNNCYGVWTRQLERHQKCVGENS
ncbi:MAG: lysozyme [Acinetobacter calcoaceticus]